MFIFPCSEQDPGSTVLNVLPSLDVLAGEPTEQCAPVILVWRRQSRG